MLELLYLSVAVLTAYVGLMYLRRAGPAQRTYAWLLLIDAALAGGAYLASREGAPSALAELVGAVSLFGFVGLVLLPPVLKSGTRRALAHEQDRLAIWLTMVREILTPGLGARQEREMIEAARAVRAGHTDKILAALRTRRAAVTDARERQAIEDRILVMLLSAGRWKEAIEVFDARSEGAIRPGQVPILVEIVHAHGELGDLEAAARLVAFLEHLPGANEPALAQHIARARLLFLAFGGRAEAVERVLAVHERSLSPDARAYWLGVARLFAGDADGARASFAESIRRAADRRRRVTAEERLALVRVGIEPREVSPELAAFADEVAARAVAAAADAPPILEGLRPGVTPVTWIAIAANVAVFAVVSVLFGTTTESFVLARAGANYGPAVNAGEWWRLVACTFLHAGGLHIAANMFGIWSIGRIVEQMVGSLRFGAIYAVAAIGGSLASHFFGGHGVSAGASGALFGILGAAIVEVAMRRGAKWPAWRAGLLNNLIFIAAANLAIGYATPIIDQSAHVGGLVSGALAALLFSVRHFLGRGAVARAFAMVICAAGIAACAVAIWGVVVSPYARTINRIGWRETTIGGVVLDVPRSWEPGEEKDALTEPIWGVRTLVAEKRAPEDLAGVLSEIKDGRVKEKDVTDVEVIPPEFAAPAGWSVRELHFVAVAQEASLPIREKVFLRLAPDGGLAIDFLVPEGATEMARPVIERIVRSARPAQ